jgi:hypothetical protein
MSSPNGSIANLSVTRKTLAGGTARSRIRALFELRAAPRFARRCLRLAQETRR